MQPDAISEPRCVHERAGGLDIEAFPEFAALLIASQDYAALSGRRFRAGSFDELLEASDRTELTGVCNDAALRLEAKHAAVAVVAEFRKRLKYGDESLTEEMERASSEVLAESVRNGMVGTCQKLELWPPYPPPEGSDENDCDWEGSADTLDVVAQRLFNDEMLRPRCPVCGLDILVRRAVTASYIVDFSYDAGLELPPMPPKYEILYNEFTAAAFRWEQEHRPGESLCSLTIDERRHQETWVASRLLGRRGSRRRATIGKIRSLWRRSFADGGQESHLETSDLQSVSTMTCCSDCDNEEFSGVESSFSMPSGRDSILTQIEQSPRNVMAFCFDPEQEIACIGSDSAHSCVDVWQL